MRKFKPDELGYEEKTVGGAKYAIVRVGKKFCLCCWSKHDKNWTRENRLHGYAFHRNPLVLATDNLAGGPRARTLSEIDEEIQND